MWPILIGYHGLLSLADFSTLQGDNVNVISVCCLLVQVPFRTGAQLDVCQGSGALRHRFCHGHHPGVWH